MKTLLLTSIIFIYISCNGQLRRTQDEIIKYFGKYKQLTENTLTRKLFYVDKDNVLSVYEINKRTDTCISVTVSIPKSDVNEMILYFDTSSDLTKQETPNQWVNHKTKTVIDLESDDSKYATISYMVEDYVKNLLKN